MWHLEMNLKHRKASAGIGLLQVFLFNLVMIFLYFLIKYWPSVGETLGLEQGLPSYIFTADGIERVYHDKNGKLINKPTYDILTGYDLARKNGINSHAECRRMKSILAVSGCHKYVTEHKNIPPHIVQETFNGGKSTAQCREEVRDYYEAVMQDMIEQNDEDAAKVVARRRMQPELEECQNYDNLRPLSGTQWSGGATSISASKPGIMNDR